MAEPDSNCGNCRFFKNQQIMGICRYGPQQQIKHQSDWCGKHKQVEFVELPVYDILTDQIRRKPGRPKKC